MNVKSRYEVVLELENKKRSLIENKNNLKDDRLAKEKAIKDLIRQRDDTIVIINRKIDDAEEDLANFDANLQENIETIDLLIKSTDAALLNFSKKD
jgi:hypothetical protein